MQAAASQFVDRRCVASLNHAEPLQKICDMKPTLFIIQSLSDHHRACTQPSESFRGPWPVRGVISSQSAAVWQYA